jgi:succinate-semialdehyde dehydrogenase/glutarate-semialdehyde dehydrogenase
MENQTLSMLDSYNPATKELIGQVPRLDQAGVSAVVDKAWLAFDNWRNTEIHERISKVLELRKIIHQHKDDIAELITKEVGKPLSESYLAELTGPLDTCIWLAENSERFFKDQIVGLSNPLMASKQAIIVFEPLGVIGIISPWNYPFAIPVMAILMSLMAGNTVVLKPSEKSPLIGIKIAELFREAGFEEGVVQVITGDRTTGEYLTKQKLSKLIFTGSVNAGKAVMSQCAAQLTPVSLELGGKDPAIVLPGVDPQWTAQGLVWGAFTNCGQACASIERLYLIKDQSNQALIDNIVSQAKALHLGNGLDPETEIGPLIDELQLQKVQEQVADAVEKGAKILCGGRSREDLGGYFYEPTVLTNVNHKMLVMTEETFGPLLPIMIVDNEDQALVFANDSNYGLCASIWGKDLSTAEDLAYSLDAGTVFINDALFSFACPQVPWGGLKLSGSGRSHSYFGLMDLVQVKHINIDGSGGSKRIWWFPYGKNKLKTAKSGVDALHGGDIFAKGQGMLDFLKGLMGS